jgi:hypothetical protein
MNKYRIIDEIGRGRDHGSTPAPSTPNANTQSPSSNSLSNPIPIPKTIIYRALERKSIQYFAVKRVDKILAKRATDEVSIQCAPIIPFLLSFLLIIFFLSNIISRLLIIVFFFVFRSCIVF